MADLSIDMSAYQYGQGLTAIGLMFEAAKGALLAQQEDINDCITEYRRSVDSGGDPIGEWEDGHRLWDQEDLYRLQQLAIEDAIVELRVATVVAIYHHWERHVPGGETNPKRNMNNLLNDARLHDVPCHGDIDALQYSANYFKHGNDDWRQKLVARWPERFKENLQWSATNVPWIRKISISDDDIVWFLELAMHSTRPVMKDWAEK
jgi:hypothetical protein